MGKGEMKNDGGWKSAAVFVSLLIELGCLD